ncbi:MAG: PIG-L family deacetylase [Pirellulaceae bacterium]
MRLTRLSGSQLERSDNLAAWLKAPAVEQETWLLVSPHDDDLALGAGMLIPSAVAAGVDVQVLIVTDGCLGYCTREQEADIVDIRRRETFDSFELLGVRREQITYIDYPDGGLTPYIGRRKARPGEPEIGGYVGLQNALTHHLRRLRPARVWVPTHTDLHPDHRITHSELMISLFHASGAIWPELGRPLDAPPAVYEMAVYCDFSEPPNLEMIGDDDLFQKKLHSLAAYASQTQIAALVANTRAAGAYEYFREVAFRLYSAKAYRALFDPDARDA